MKTAPRNPSTRESYEERFVRVLSYIQTHLDDAISPVDLATLAGFSPHHFHRIFRGMVGESVMGHIRRLRLERAAWRLKFTDLPITRLAFEACYETHESFTRAFKGRFGAAPRDFRAARRQLEFPAAPTGVHYHPRGEVPALSTACDPPGLLSIRLSEERPREVACRRHVGPYDQVGEAWERLCIWAAREGLLGPGAQMIGLSYDDPEITPSDRLRYDACLTVNVGFTPQGEIGRRTIPGGEYATARHVGPYHQLSSTYEELFGRWLPASGREPVALPTVEIYWNDPDTTPPEELETDLGILLQPRV